MLPGAVAAVDVPNDRQKHTVESSARVQTLLRGPRSSAMYFYVPRGTQVIGGYAQGRPVLVDGSGKAVQQLSLEPDYFSVPVPPGQDGKIWRVDRITKILLMTVPPFLARSADELLLPEEVMEAERLK